MDVLKRIFNFFFPEAPEEGKEIYRLLQKGDNTYEVERNYHNGRKGILWHICSNPNRGFSQECFDSKEEAIDFIKKNIEINEEVEVRRKVVNIFTEEDLGVRNGKTD